MKRFPAYGGNTLAIVATVTLHLGVLLVAVFIHLQQPDSADRDVHVWFQGRPIAEPPPDRPPEKTERKAETGEHSRQRAPIVPQPPAVPRTRVTPPAAQNEPLVVQAATPGDSVTKERTMTFRHVLDRDLSPEEALDILSELLESHPEYKNLVVRDMIAGAGLPRDSLPPIDLALDQIFKNGIPKTWDTQRGAVESAWKSYDPVMGWTNKGGYGPQVNVLGIIKFLLDLIQGK